MSFGNRGDWKYGVLVTFLVAIASLIVVLFFQRNLYAAVSEAEEDRACELSIYAAERSKTIPSLNPIQGTGRQRFPLRCPRKDLVLKYDGVVEGGVINQDKAHKILADAMYRCWRKVGAGKRDPFSNWDNDGESHCLICDVISYDKELIGFINARSTSITKETPSQFFVTSPLPYLATHRIPLPSSTMSYWEYLYHEKPEFKKEELSQVQDIFSRSLILPGSAIVVTMYKPDSKSTRLKYVGYVGGGIAIVAGLILIPFTAGASTALVAAGLTKVAVVGIGIGVVGLAGGSALALHTGYQSFKDCPTCQGIGSIHIIPQEMAFSEKIKIGVDGKEQEVALCTMLEN